MANNKTQSSVTTLDDTTPETQAASAAAAPESVQVKGANHDAELGGKKVTITIHSSNEEGGQEAVKVGLNGYMYLIPRNKPSEVPVEVAEVIKNAVVQQLKLTADGKGHTAIDVPRYAYSISAA